MVLAPEPMANLIVSAAVVLLASRIAWRSDPAPLSLVLITVNVENRKRPSTLSITTAALGAPLARRAVRLVGWRRADKQYLRGIFSPPKVLIVRSGRTTARVTQRVQLWQLHARPGMSWG